MAEEDGDPEVLYLDNHLLVLSKPAGMLTQSDVTGDRDLLTWGRALIRERFAKPGNVFLGLVHRLDRPASGVVAMARTSKAAERLSRQFRGRTVSKTYLALVDGGPPDAGRFTDRLVKRDRSVEIAAPDDPAGRDAALTWTVLHRGAGLCLVRIDLETGRKHQIRVQFGSRGWPLLGDFRYGSAQPFDGRNLALHGFRLALDHPTLRRRMTFEAPLPPSWDHPWREVVSALPPV